MKNIRLTMINENAPAEFKFLELCFIISGTVTCHDRWMAQDHV
jgi:hypothetical protein